MDKLKIQMLKERLDVLVQDDAAGQVEFWYAREMLLALGYNRWENFENVIKKAFAACLSAQQSGTDHFRDVTKMVQLGSGATRKIDDIALTRYACYLIAQNGDPRKEEIAFAQSYFALQTRKQELIEELPVEEDLKKLERRVKRDEKNITDE